MRVCRLCTFFWGALVPFLLLWILWFGPIVCFHLNIYIYIICMYIYIYIIYQQHGHPPQSPNPPHKTGSRKECLCSACDPLLWLSGVAYLNAALHALRSLRGSSKRRTHVDAWCAIFCWKVRSVLDYRMKGQNNATLDGFELLDLPTMLGSEHAAKERWC